MRKIYKSIALVFALILGMQTAAWGQITGATTAKDSIQHGVILHCFDWKYTDIQAELDNIKAAGFTAIQTSPVQGNYTGNTEWTTLYRPRNPSGVGPTVLGNETQLKALCAAAHAKGLKIIVDVVANHTDSSLGYATSPWNTNSSTYYHTSTSSVNYNSRSSIINDRMGGLFDVNTGSTTVQSLMHTFVEQLKADGVDGIRWDAAKHIGLPSEGDNFWKTVPDQDMFNYGEILDGTGGNDATLMKEYYQYIGSTDNKYSTNNLLSSAKNSTAPSVSNVWAGTYSTNKLVYWGESHDNFCNSGDASYGVSQEVVDRAYAIAASHNQIPALYLSRPIVSNNTSNTRGPSARAGVKGSTHFTESCVAEVNKLHNLMDGTAEYYSHSGAVASMTRAGGGAIIVNFKGAGSVSIANGGGYLPAKTYTDHVSGNTFTVTSTTISGTTNSTGIAVLYEDGAAGVSITPADETFTSETLDVTLTPNSNTTSYTYKVGTGSVITVNGNTATTVTIGSGIDYGNTVTISWTATNGSNETVSGSKTYTKKDPNDVFEPTLDSADEHCVFLESNTYSYIYAFSSSNSSILGAWPGKAMTKVGETEAGVPVYKYTISDTEFANMPASTASTSKNGIIFNNNNGSQIPGSLQGGLAFHDRGYYVEGTYTRTISKVSGIGSISVEPQKTADNYWYTLTGARLSQKPAQRGIYIHGGRKVVVR